MLRFACLVFSFILAASLSVQAQEPNRAVTLRVPPEYPELARRMHVAGTVLVEASIRPDGTVAGARTQSGHALLSPAAEMAVRRWHFAPAPAATQTVVAVRFNGDSQ